MLDHQTSLMNERPTSTNLHVLNSGSPALPLAHTITETKWDLSKQNEHIPKQNGVTGHVSQYEVPVLINPVARRTANQLADLLLRLPPAGLCYILHYLSCSQLNSYSTQLVLTIQHSEWFDNHSICYEFEGAAKSGRRDCAPFRYT